MINILCTNYSVKKCVYVICLLRQHVSKDMLSRLTIVILILFIYTCNIHTCLVLHILYMYTHIYTFIVYYRPPYMQLCMYIYIYYLCVYIYICVYIYTYIYIYIFMWTRTLTTGKKWHLKILLEYLQVPSSLHLQGIEDYPFTVSPKLLSKEIDEQYVEIKWE